MIRTRNQIIKKKKRKLFMQKICNLPIELPPQTSLKCMKIFLSLNESGTNINTHSDRKQRNNINADEQDFYESGKWKLIFFNNVTI